MTKTKFSVELHKAVTGNSNGILLAIGNHNGGIVPLCIEDFISYVQVERAKYPHSNEGFYIKRDDSEPHIIHVSDDAGKTWTMTIEERIIEELDPIHTKDIVSL